MLTWEYEDYCILTESWHIHNKFELVLSMLFTVFLGMAYEYFKKLSSQYLAKIKPKVLESPQLSSYNGFETKTWKRYKTMSSVIYGFKVFFSFLLMLLFMSFNYWIMISLSVGSLMGYFFFNQSDDDTDSLLCH